MVTTFAELTDGQMFRHVAEEGRVVAGVLRKGLDAVAPGNAVGVATQEWWCFPGETEVQVYEPLSEAGVMLAAMRAEEWPKPGKRMCEECGVRRRCDRLVRDEDMTLCEAVVLALHDGGAERAVTRRRRSGGWHQGVRHATVVDRT